MKTGYWVLIIDDLLWTWNLVSSSASPFLLLFSPLLLLIAELARWRSGTEDAGTGMPGAGASGTYGDEQGQCCRGWWWLGRECPAAGVLGPALDVWQEVETPAWCYDTFRRRLEGGSGRGGDGWGSMIGGIWLKSQNMFSCRQGW